MQPTSRKTMRIGGDNSLIPVIGLALMAVISPDLLQHVYSAHGLRVSQSHADLLSRIAETDSTFVLKDGLWVGRCLICGGPLCFDNWTGDGATIEHILPRSLVGTNDLR